MKRFSRLFIFFAACSVLTLSSCSKDNDDNGDNNNPPPARKDFLEANTGGVMFNDLASIVINYDDTKGVVDILAKHKDQVKVMNLIFSINMGNDLNFAVTEQAAAGYQPNTQETYQAMSGNLTLTKNDKSARIVEGTFSFTAQELTSGASMAVTAGKFSVKY